jgi:hypothetical protein
MILDKNICLNNVMLKVSPRNKKNSLQFLPESLVELSKSTHFQYKETKLKTAYIIDIVHNLLLKYYFKKENSFTLSSVILKDKYGYLYNYYINFLKDNGILRLQKNYLKGSNSRIYALNENILTGQILRYKNSDKVLIKKYIIKHLQFELDKSGIIEKDIKSKLVSDLYSVQIEFDRSIFYLDSLKNEDIDIYNRNKYSVESINDKHIFYHFDSYGRMHTNFTILKSFIRKNCLLIDGEETCEIDINNSQPLFLCKLIQDSGTRWVKEDEFRLFSILVKGGNYYQYLIDNLKLDCKSEAKKLTYKVLFGQNRVNSKPDKLFQSLFPSIHNFIKLYKKENSDYKILAYDLQKAESNLIFNCIIRRIMNLDPDIKIVTVHDSIIFQKKWKETVSNIFFNEIFEHFDNSFQNQSNI